MVKSNQSKPRLGRGLSSLISNSAAIAKNDSQYMSDTGAMPAIPSIDGRATIKTTSTEPKEIPIENIAPNPYQPRKEFREEDLAELTESIRQQGIIQPLIVTTSKSDDGEKPFVLIAGERRLRASKQAGLENVPCIIKQVDQRQMVEWALIENIQRSDLNPIERAQAYRQYIDRFNLSQAQAAEKLAQPRTTVANYLRLLDLQDNLQKMLCEGTLSFGHAKVLAGLANDPQHQLYLARRIASKNLSVRQLEGLIESERLASGKENASDKRTPKAKPAYIIDLEEKLTQTVGTRVRIKQGRAKNTGQIHIDFYSLDDFDRLSGYLGLKEEE